MSRSLTCRRTPQAGEDLDIEDENLLVRCPDVVKADDRLMEHGVDKVALNPLNPKIYEKIKVFLTKFLIYSLINTFILEEMK